MANGARHCISRSARCRILASTQSGSVEAARIAASYTTGFATSARWLASRGRQEADDPMVAGIWSTFALARRAWQSATRSCPVNLVDNNPFSTAAMCTRRRRCLGGAEQPQRDLSQRHSRLVLLRRSVGWDWDYAPNRCHHNTIEYNHIHHVLKAC